MIKHMINYMFFHMLNCVFNHVINQVNIFSREGVFPYDYVSSFEKLKEANLPSKADFFSSLYNTHISNEDYEHAQHV